jgi:hypothetical protein
MIHKSIKMLIGLMYFEYLPIWGNVMVADLF